jgi:rubrerythrin
MGYRYDFTADDVFEMAEQLEHNGAQFYRDAAERVGPGAERDFLLGLAGMEDQHAQTFKRMRADLTAQEVQATVFDPQNEAVAYLHALADTRVFFEKEIDVSTLQSILTAAIEAEKDAIVFYLGIKEAVPEKLGRRRLDAIIKEEMGHIQQLSRKLVAIRA